MTGIAGVLFARMIERLGIADEVNKKSKLVAGHLNATFVAKGEAELAVQLSREIRTLGKVEQVASGYGSSPADLICIEGRRSHDRSLSL
jgi:hypothetical protein